MKKNDRILVVAMAFVAVIMLSVVYAAFANAITVTAKGNAVGTMAGITQTVSCTSAVGLTSATAPSAVTSTSGNTVTINGTLHQPGDKLTCTITYKNNNAFAVKTTNGTTGCESVTGTAASAVGIAVTKVAAGTTLQPSSTTTGTVVISFYSGSSQSDPTAKTASVACAVAWAQA